MPAAATTSWEAACVLTVAAKISCKATRAAATILEGGNLCLGKGCTDTVERSKGGGEKKRERVPCTMPSIALVAMARPSCVIIASAPHPTAEFGSVGTMGLINLLLLDPKLEPKWLRSLSQNGYGVSKGILSNKKKKRLRRRGKPEQQICYNKVFVSPRHQMKHVDCKKHNTCGRPTYTPSDTHATQLQVAINWTEPH